MKYQLINQQTGEQTICDKVTIDGFDYYVSEDKPKENDWCIKEQQYYGKSLNKAISYSDLNSTTAIWKKIIATNNPNIDVPKVVDEVERLKFIYNEGGNKDVFTTGVLTGIEIGYNKSQETHSFSDEDMVEFYEWCDTSAEANLFWRRNRIELDMNGKHHEIIKQKRKELLQLWKEQQPKKVYYEK